MPDGVPRYVRCYDGGEELFDRYTVVYCGRWPCRGRRFFFYIGMSKHPYHPQGFGQHGDSDRPIDVNADGWAPAIGRKNHLGVRIAFHDLPPDCQEVVIADYKEIWNLKEDTCQATTTEAVA
jgi:hypothetical protein